MKRSKTDESVTDEITFSAEPQRARLSVSVVSRPALPTFAAGEEYMTFLVEFPGKQKPHAIHIADAASGASIFTVALLGGGVPRESVEMFGKTYAIHDTHQVVCDGIAIEAVFVTLENASYDDKDGSSVRLRVQLSPNAYMESLFPGRFVDETRFFPPDVDAEATHMKLDPRRVQQRTPAWMAIRNAARMSGTRAYKSIGYYTSDSGPPDARGRANMRYGSQSEDYALLLLLHAYPHMSVRRVGWCRAPAGRFPHGWGASPDGLLDDPSVSALPASIAQHYASLDAFEPITRGVLEIKSSKSSLAFSPYFLPQVYAEMIATNTLWCMLVRVRANREARLYRIFRHPLVEERLVRLLKRAAGAPDLEALVQEQPYEEMRRYFQSVAEKLPFAQATLSAEHAQHYEDYCARVRTHSPQASSSAETRRLLDELDAQHAQIMARVRDEGALRALCIAQSAALSSCSSKHTQ